MVRKVTVEKFEAWIAEEGNVAEVLRLISEGKTLQKAAVAVRQPYMCLHPWFHATPERLSRYESARKAWADMKMDEALEIADGVPADRDAVAKAKLRVETRANQARAYHRERWGERLQVERSVTVGVDAGLIGTIGELLRVRAPRVLEGEENTVTLPAPSEDDAD